MSDPPDGTTDPIAVLHVDDDPDFVELAATALEAEDDRLHVSATTDIKAALDRLDAGEVDCVVSDYEMPAMDGIAFLEASGSGLRSSRSCCSPGREARRSRARPSRRG